MVDKVDWWVDTLKNLDVEKYAKQTVFTMGQVEFEIRPHDAWSSFDQLDHIRDKLGNFILQGNIIGMMKLESEFVKKQILPHVLEKTYFRTPNMDGSRMRLKDNEAMAFDREFDMHPEYVYQLIGRWICINFTISSKGIVSMLGTNLDLFARAILNQ